MTINLDKFKIIKECKGNKSNRIFIVEDRDTSQTLILKIIRIHDVEKQLREIEVHKRLNHKYVIKLVDYDVSRSYIILLVEYAKYGDLFTHLGRLRELPEKSVLKFFYQVTKAIHYLHSNGFVHRDIKPENILITRKFSPRVADFGTSAQTGFIKNTYCGTAEYMAPEIMLRLQQSEKVDVWALGILLYEMMHNFTPFKNENPQAILKRIESQKIRFRNDMNVAIRTLILKILRFKPEERPSTWDILNDPVFADFRGNIEEKKEEFGAERTDDWDKKVDAKVANRLREYKKSLSDPKAQKPGPLHEILGHLTDKGASPKLDTKNKSFQDLASIKANKNSVLKDRSSRENSKINDELGAQTNAGVFAKSMQSFPEFSEKMSQNLGSNVIGDNMSGFGYKRPEQGHDKRHMFYEEMDRPGGMDQEKMLMESAKKNFVSANILDRQAENGGVFGPKAKMLPVNRPFCEKPKKNSNECSLHQI